MPVNAPPDSSLTLRLRSTAPTESSAPQVMTIQAPNPRVRAAPSIQTAPVQAQTTQAQVRFSARKAASVRVSNHTSRKRATPVSKSEPQAARAKRAAPSNARGEPLYKFPSTYAGWRLLGDSDEEVMSEQYQADIRRAIELGPQTREAITKILGDGQSSDYDQYFDALFEHAKMIEEMDSEERDEFENIWKEG